MKQKIIYLLLSLILISCAGKKEGAYPEKLVIGFTGGDDPSERMNNVNKMARYLEKETGIKKVEVFVSTSYAAIIEGMRAKKVDIAQLGELSYIMAAERSGAEAIVMIGEEDGKRFTSSAIITSSASGLKTMDDVIRRSKELSLSFADPASTSGHLYPRNYLNSIGLEPETSFRKVSFTQDHTSSIMTAISGKVDITCTYTTALYYMIAKGRITPDSYTILWKSEPYIPAPISVRGDLPADLKEKIKQAYLQIHKKDPELWKTYKKIALRMYPDSIRDQLIYVETHDSLYNGIREMARNVKGFVFLNEK